LLFLADGNGEFTKAMDLELLHTATHNHTLLLLLPATCFCSVQHPTGSAVLFLADGNGEFTKAMDLELDGSGFGLGSRSQRYAAVIEDGVVSWLTKSTCCKQHIACGSSFNSPSRKAS
jgi:peroxiredoxin